MLYRPNCVITKSMKEKAGITDDNDFRKYLKNNAVKIITSNRECIPYKECSLCPTCKKALQN